MWTTASGGVALHQFGSAVDPALPLPVSLAGAVLCLALGLWSAVRTPAPASPPRPGRPAPRALARLVGSRWWVRGWRGVGLLAALLLLVPLVLGPDRVDNPALGVHHVLVVTGLLPLSALLGPVVRALSPARTIDRTVARVLRSTPGTGVTTYPSGWGVRPGAATLLALAWQVQVDPRASYVDTLQVWLTAYLVLVLVGAAVVGDTWFARADPFEVASTAIARMSPWDRDADGRLVVRRPWHHLADAPAAPGTRSLVAVALGAAAYDVLSQSSSWTRLVGDWPLERTLAASLVLVGLCALAWLLQRLLAGDGSWSLLPVAVTLFAASHLTYLLEEGRTTVLRLGDPLVRGDGAFGPSTGSFVYALGYHPAVLAGLQAVLVVVGVVVGLLADRARPRPGRTAPLPLLIAAWGATGLVLMTLR